MFTKLAAKTFQIELRSHARAILSIDFPGEVSEIEAVLDVLSIPAEELVRGGGGESPVTQ